MAITKRTLELERQLKITVNTIIDSSTQEMVGSWVRAWDEHKREWQDAVNDLMASGEWPSRREILRASRATRALNHSTEVMSDLVERATGTASARVRDVLDSLPELQGRIIASQMPKLMGDEQELFSQFARFDRRAVNAIVRRTQDRITSSMWPITAESRDALYRTLVRGVSVGENPNQAARLMMRRLEGDFNGGLSRAMNITRTEMIDAHREGARVIQNENSDVLDGWVWSAELSPSTCSSCWAMHGTIFQLKEEGPLDHQSGRCARVPVTKSWQELGFDIEEPESVLPDARTAFNELSVEDQLRVLGPERMQGLSTGAIKWEDLPQKKSSREWRDSFHPIKATTVRKRVNQRFSRAS